LQNEQYALRGGSFDTPDRYRPMTRGEFFPQHSTYTTGARFAYADAHPMTFARTARGGAFATNMVTTYAAQRETKATYREDFTLLAAFSTLGVRLRQHGPRVYTTRGGSWYTPHQENRVAVQGDAAWVRALEGIGARTAHVARLDVRLHVRRGGSYTEKPVSVQAVTRNARPYIISGMTGIRLMLLITLRASTVTMRGGAWYMPAEVSRSACSEWKAATSNFLNSAEITMRLIRWNTPGILDGLYTGRGGAWYAHAELLRAADPGMSGIIDIEARGGRILRCPQA
jgi:hypothetical protein